MKKNSGSLNENNPNLMKRRSKHDVEGRDYTCPICKKGYLSYAALYTHRKSKHETENKQRGRGRPKKEENENLIEKNRYNPINFTFFAKEGRTGKTSLAEINNCIDKAFIEIYSECNSDINKSRNMKKYNRETIINAHPYISVNIAAKNMQDYIERNLLSILNQSFQNFEIIIVNDGSEDETENIINRVQLTDKRIKLV